MAIAEESTSMDTEAGQKTPSTCNFAPGRGIMLSSPGGPPGESLPVRFLRDPPVKVRPGRLTSPGRKGVPVKSGSRLGKAWLLWSGVAVVFAGFAVAVVVLLLWLAGWFSPKVSRARRPSRLRPRRSRGTSSRCVCCACRVPNRRSGRSAPCNETNIGSRLLARVEEVTSRPVSTSWRGTCWCG